MPGDSSDDTATSAQSKEATSTEDPAKTETPASKDMKAVVLTGFGGLKMVKIQTKPQPTAGEGQVLIRVKAW